MSRVCCSSDMKDDPSSQADRRDFSEDVDPPQDSNMEEDEEEVTEIDVDEVVKDVSSQLRIGLLCQDSIWCNDSASLVFLMI